MRTPAVRDRPKILVVDDEPAIVTTLSAILTSSGYVTEVAFNGKEAVDMAATFSPDLLLSDVVMPTMNGVDAALAITARLPACKVLLISGTARSTDLLPVRRNGNPGFTLLNKPIHPEQLLQTLQSLLNGGSEQGVA